MNPLIEQLTHGKFGDVSVALLSRRDRIIVEWDAAVRQAMPNLDALTTTELKDSLPRILEAVAHAMASSDPAQIAELVADAPLQGLTRFHQQYELPEIMQEDRLLRGTVVLQVEDELGRQMTSVEAAALHSTVDVMLQRAVVALVEEQKGLLRSAAERELKYVSFLSHDLNNNLGSVTLWLNLLREELRALPQFAEAAEHVNLAQQAIRDTVDGMRRLLDHERLRKGTIPPVVKRVDLHALASNAVHQHETAAAAKGIVVGEEVEPGTVVGTDPELVMLVLQNLVGNAVKYSVRGTVRVRADRRREGGRWVLSVSDEGPGIARADRDRIFEAFGRGEVHGKTGVGLGLAIAGQAARLLGADIGVDSEIGRGSTFWLALPSDSG